MPNHFAIRHILMGSFPFTLPFCPFMAKSISFPGIDRSISTPEAKDISSQHFFPGHRSFGAKHSESQKSYPAKAVCMLLHFFMHLRFQIRSFQIPALCLKARQISRRKGLYLVIVVSQNSFQKSGFLPVQCRYVVIARPHFPFPK